MLVTKDGAVPVIKKARRNCWICPTISSTGGAHLANFLFSEPARVPRRPMWKPSISSGVKRAWGSPEREFSEHIGPNGSVIEVRSTPLPDGGMVQTSPRHGHRRQPSSTSPAWHRKTRHGLPNRRVFRTTIEKLSTSSSEVSTQREISRSCFSISTGSRPSTIRSAIGRRHAAYRSSAATAKTLGPSKVSAHAAWCVSAATNSPSYCRHSVRRRIETGAHRRHHRPAL